MFDDDNELDPADSEPNEEELEYVSPNIGRELGEQQVPRFDIDKLRPFEAVFVDNKDYPCKVRGGAETFLVFIDYKTRTKHKVDLHSKAHNGLAFRKLVAREGIHKLPYHCRVYTDGCGSMNHVRDTAVLLGIDHQFIPPHQQSLNEAEKVCDSIFVAVRTVMEHHNAPSQYFSLVVDLAMYTDLRTATTASRNWKTPYEMSHGTMPFIGKIHRPFTKCFVQVPKSKRRKLAAQGLENLRAEPGRFVGFHGPHSSTYAVLLDKQLPGQPERLVHSRSASFNDRDYIMPSAERARKQADSRVIGFEGKYDAAASEEAETEQSNSNPLYGGPEASTDIGEDDYECFDLDKPENQPWFTHADAPQPRPRPTYNKMCIAMKHEAIIHMVMNVHKEFDDSEYTECTKILNASIPRHEDHRMVAHILTAHSQTDMGWDKALASDDQIKVIEALEKEMESLTSTILTEVNENDEEYHQACELATPGRILLGIKRSGMYKSRGVKQGFKEDTEQADGPNFNHPGSLAWDVDNISQVRRVFLI